MKTKLKSILIIFVLLAIYVSAVDANTSYDTHHELAIEVIAEFESSETQQYVDDFLMYTETTISISSTLVLCNEPNFILLNLEKDIFRPPLFA